MAVNTIAGTVERKQPELGARDKRLGLAAFGGPVVWSLQFAVLTAASTSGWLCRLGTNTPVLVVSGLALALTVLATVICQRARREIDSRSHSRSPRSRTTDASDTTTPEAIALHARLPPVLHVRRAIAGSGVVTGISFSLLVVGTALPAWMIGPCP